MSDDTVERTCARIDQTIRLYPWMDFEFVGFSFVDAVITGSLDTSSKLHELELRFQDVAFVVAASSWPTDTSQSVFFLADPSDEARLRDQFEIVERHHHVFAIRPEVGQALFYVAAASVELLVLRPPNAGQHEPQQ